MQKHIQEIEVRLNNEDHLFVIPEANPLQGEVAFEPGIDTIYDLVRKTPVRKEIHLRLFLPKERITPELPPKIADAIARYCDFQTAKITGNLEIQSRQGRRALYYGITILVVCLILSGLGLYISSNVSSAGLIAFGGFMYNGFMIIGWVSLWTPTSMLLFERWPDWISRNTYQRIHDMKIEILPRAKNTPEPGKPQHKKTE